MKFIPDMLEFLVKPFAGFYAWFDNHPIVSMILLALLAIFLFLAMINVAPRGRGLSEI